MKKLDRKQKRILFIIAGVIGFIVLVIWLATRKKTVVQTNASSIDQSLFPLQYGSRGAYVEVVQRWIIKKGGILPVYGVDGILGTETQGALKLITGKETVSYTDYLNIIKEA